MVLVALLVVVPGLSCVTASAVPFLPLATATRLRPVPVLVVVAEAVYGVAALLFSRQGISRYRRSFDSRNRPRGSRGSSPG